MTEFVVTDPSGKEFIVDAPPGATQDQALEFAKSQFGSTQGGAATGNPNLARQGDKAIRGGLNLNPVVEIGGAAAIGGALGAASKEILTGAGNVVGSFPQPFARSAGGFLKGAGQLIGAGGRTVPAIAGAISGLAGETAGQVVDMTQTGKENPIAGEAARIVGGGLTPEVITLGKTVLQKYIQTPALSLMSKFKKETAISILEKFDKMPQSLSAQERKFLDSEIAALRGGTKDNKPLEEVGSIMGDEGKRLMDVADQRLIAAQAQAAGARNAPGAEMSAVGGGLRDTITKRNEVALKARSAQYTKTEDAVNNIVSSREKAGSYVNDLPEFKAIVDGLKSELDNTEAMKRSPDMQASLRKALNAIESSEVIPGEKKLVQNGLNLDLQELPGKPKPTAFKAIDDLRRQLGEVFKGKESEGYQALKDTEIGKNLYAKLRDIQIKYAGGETGPQAKLLDDYHNSSDALTPFRTKLGKKATALDQYQEGTFATDASTLPSTYFQTKASVQALKELTGNQAQVNHAALEYANKKLVGADSKAVRNFLRDNSDWLPEVGPTRTLLDRYATKLEGVERSLNQATSFAEKAVADNKLLVGKGVPAVQAKALIESGDAELWRKIAPAMYNEPAAKASMVNAVRQVIADQATAKATGDLFSVRIRPFLEGTNIASKAEMDFIAQKLASIQAMQVPEAEKLGIAKRIILQAASGWAASAASRTGVSGYEWSREKMVPQ